LPVKTFPELVAYGRANPGKLNFASAGIGTTPHLAGEMFKLRTGIDATHIPYKGIGASYTDMMSGKVQMAFSSIAGALPFTTDNRVRAIATTGAKRVASIPICRPSPRRALRDSKSTCGWACSHRPNCLCRSWRV
jgi:tripartite-type tricarboxylate transporter receptor subunit TctC